MARRKARSSTRSSETGWRTERRHAVNVAAETALRESEQIRRLVLDNVDEIVYLVEMGADNTVSGRVRFVSGRVEKILGYRPEEFVRDRELWFSLIHPDDVPAMADSTRAIMASRQPGLREYRLRHKETGDYHWLEDHVVPRLDAAGVVSGQFGVARDITERKQAEEALRESEERLRVGLNTANIAVFNQDTDLRYIWMYQPQLGYTSEQVVGHTDAELLPLEAARQVMEIKRRVLEGGLRERAEVPVSAGGQTFVYDLVVEPLRDVRGAIIGLIGASLDITERKQAEEALRKLSSAIEQTADNVYICNKDGVIEYVNPAFEALTGYTQAEAIGQTPRLLKSGRHPPKFFEALWKTILAGKVFRATFANRKKNGEVYYEEKTISPLRDAQGNITHFVSTGKDITERIQAEQALRESEEKYRTLVSEVSDGIFVADERGRLLFANRALAQIHGVESPQALVGRDFLEFVAPAMVNDVRERYRKTIEEGTTQEAVSVEIVRADGTIAVIEIKPTFIVEEGKVVGARGVVRDITERKRSETALRQQLAELKVLHAIATLGVAVSDEDELIEKATRVIGDALFPDDFGVLLLDAAAGSLRIHPSYRGISEAFKHALISVGRGVTGQVAATGQPRRIGDAAREPNYLALEMGMRSELCAPLKAGERVIGVINAESTRLDAYSEADERLLATLRIKPSKMLP